MFHFISWSDFMVFILFLTVAYWLAIALIYYWAEILSFFKKTNRKSFNTPSKYADQAQEDLFDECTQCALQIKSFIRENALHGIDKENLIQELQLVVKPYVHFIGTMWQIPINHVIEYECIHRVSLTITEADIKEIWSN